MNFDLLPAAAVLLMVQGASTGFEAVKTYKSYNTPLAIAGTGVVHTPVIAGHDVMVHWTLQKFVDCPGTSSRVWRGEGGFYNIESKNTTALPLDPNPTTYQIPTHVPFMAPIGSLTLEIVGSYDCGDILGNREFTLGPVHINVIE